MTQSDRIIRVGDERLIVAPKILIADDEPDLITTCARLLRRLGHICLTAQTGEEAIALIDAERPKLVVTDLRLTAVDGLAVARHARNCSPPVPVVLMTAHATPEAKREARQAGAMYLSKPFSAAEFQSAVQQALATWPD